MGIEIQNITPSQTLELRRKVLWPEKTLPELMLSEDESALHFGAFIAGHLIAVGSFFCDSASHQTRYRLRKLAVDPEYQGQGIARKLLNAAAVHLRAKGCREIWCDARVTAADFYRKCGFEVDHEVFQKQGLDYIKANLRL